MTGITWLRPDDRGGASNSKESVKALSERLGLNYKTVLKWRRRDFVYDMLMGAERPSFYSAHTRGRVDMRSLSQTLSAAVERLFVRSERANSAPFALIAA